MALDPDDPRPPYRQIADDLRRSIASGEFAPGEQLPSTVALVDKYGVAQMTVRHALKQLGEEGLVVAKHGRGVFVRTTVKTDDAPAAEIDSQRISQQVEQIAREMGVLSRRVSELESVIRELREPPQ